MTRLTLKHREVIEDALKEKMNFTDIADTLGYHRTSISSEIKKFKNAICGEWEIKKIIEKNR